MMDVQEPAQVVRRFALENDLPFRVLLDEDGRVSYDYGIRSHPMAFLIGADGYLLGVAAGYREWDRQEMMRLVPLLMPQ